MNYNNHFNTAFQFAEKRYLLRTRRNGEATFGHSVRVSQSCETPQQKIVGLLHDIVEDTNVNYWDLKNLHVPMMVIEAVFAITHRYNEYYWDYLQRVKVNKLATYVKIRDIWDNLPDCKPERLEMYLSALNYLK